MLNIIFARPRTGTNYLINLLNCTGTNYYAKGEIFHKTKPYSLKEEEWSLIFKNENDLSKLSELEAARLVRNNPLLVIDYFKQLAKSQKQEIFIKVFPSHLDFNTVKKILDDDSIRTMILDRSIIETYISVNKAQTANKWTKVDTSNLSVDLDLQAFDNWFEKMKNWYVRLQEESPNETPTFNYNEFAFLDPEKAVHKILEKLNLKSDFEFQIDKIKHKKQDSSKDILRTVTNRNEFIQHLQKNYTTHYEAIMVKNCSFCNLI
ncbi:hypothetical protein [uncultured Paraglaciecola sp.]|uniref:hypothetical protein n=1 Tax=uncultured Paraglaciecola sp. TaxID=1765024 RepID=UPI002594D404|nr:hypothetical protein [uncultured Paraglaciecola sp.]